MDSQRPLPQKPLGFFPRTHRPVFLTSAGLMVVFILAGTLWTEQAGSLFTTIKNGIAETCSGLLTGASSIFLGVAVYLMLSPYGRIRLGGPGAEPEFGGTTWFAMLFSAGMGIGLVFWSIAEPILHLKQAPSIIPGLAPGPQAMQLTYFHWGLHAWAIFTLMALALGYFCYRHHLPLTIRSAFHPLLGKRIFGPIGDAIDVTAVVATMFGVATSLGLGAMQVNSGLFFVFGMERSPAHQVLLIALITALATTSVVLGLVRGISRLSHFNLWLSAAFLAFVGLFGPTAELLENWIVNMRDYLGYVLPLGYWVETRTDPAWRSNWTTFYLAWWTAWSPFVGMFIARISRGRTIRQFILGCLFGPTIATFLWLSLFGGTALHLELKDGIAVSQVVSRDVTQALFFTLDQLPFSAFTAGVATLVIITFFVTSSDSGSLVIDIITAGGDPDPPKSQRVFWAVTEGVIASILLLGGGLNALQTAAITTGLPFAVLMLFMCYALLKALRQEAAEAQSPKRKR